MSHLVGCLRIALMSVMLVGGFGTGVRAQSLADETEIHAIIVRQLEAFDRGDQATAFALASPSIQTLFQNADHFIDMVAQGYPQLLHSRSHRFLKLETVGDALTQRVLIDGDQGSVVAIYELVRVDGEWRINGCSLEARQDA
jgi:Domain of unknown function (DUF4864)